MVSMINFWSTDHEFESWPSHIFSLFSPTWDKKWDLACPNFGECTARGKLELTDFRTLFHGLNGYPNSYFKEKILTFRTLCAIGARVPAYLLCRDQRALCTQCRSSKRKRAHFSRGALKTVHIFKPNYCLKLPICVKEDLSWFVPRKTS